MTKVPQAIGPYSIKRNSGGLMFVSGQLPIEPDTGEVVEGFENQCRRSLQNIENILKEDQLSMDSVVKITVLTTMLHNFEIINQVFHEFFKEDYPARSTYEVSRLPKNAMIEIEVIAECVNEKG